MPALILGRADGELSLSPSWQRFGVPVLALLLAGMAHRVVNLGRPDLNWLQPVARLAINAVCLGLLYPMLRAFPLVVVPGTAPASAEAAAMARGFDNRLWWILLAGLGSYWLVNVLLFARLTGQHVRHLIRRGGGRAP